MIKTGADSHAIQNVIDEVANELRASFVLLREVSFGHPEPVLKAWIPKNERPPLEIDEPISKLERLVYSQHRPNFAEDARAECASGDELLRPIVERLDASSICFAPIIYEGRLLAAIGIVRSDEELRWTTATQTRLARFAETLAPLICNIQLQGNLRRYVEDLLMLLQLAGDVSSQADLEKSLKAVVDSWSRIVGSDVAAILRWDDEAKLLRLAAAKELPTGLLERYTRGVSLSDPVCGLAATRRVGVVADLASEARFADLHAAARWSNLSGAWATPIKGPAGKLLGVIVTFSRTAFEVSTDEQRLADLFTRPAAVAIQNREQHLKSLMRAKRARQLEENLSQAQQYKTEFMSIISHELRTPLNAIIGYAQMLSDGFSGDLNEQQLKDVGTIVDSADKLLRMVEDTLDLARIDAERFPVYMDSIAFDEIIRKAVSTVQSITDAKALDIKTHISIDVPIIRTDPERVRQILANLLSNSVKFTDSGSISINVETIEAGGVQISVEDTGVGFDTVAFPHIFDEFRQADATTTRAHGGTGLGLAVSKRLVERLGGSIGVASTPGIGSVFWFRLPTEIPGADV